MGTTILIAVCAVLFAICSRLMAGSLDRERVAAYLADRRSRLRFCKWAPFGPGWLSENRARIYRVGYVAASGEFRTAYCKTSAWSGVYFTEDREGDPDGVFSGLEEKPRIR